MVNIKSLFLNFFALLFIFGASVLLFFGLVLYDLPNNVNNLLDTIEEKVSEIVMGTVGGQIEGIEESDFQILEIYCGYGNLIPEEYEGYLEYIENMEEFEQIDLVCEGINSGEVDNFQELQEYVVKDLVKEQLKEIRDEINGIVNEIHSFYLWAFGGFIILYLLCALLVWLDKWHLGEWVRAFSKFNFIAAAPLGIILLILYLTTPLLAGLAKLMIEGSLAGAQLIPGVNDVIDGIIGLVIDWIKGLLQLPMIVYILISIFGLIGWVTGFLIPKKTEKKKKN